MYKGECVVCGAEEKERNMILLNWTLDGLLRSLNVWFIFIFILLYLICVFFRPKGYPCSTNPCTEAALCTGDNPFCPISNKHKVNGTVCPEGVCFMGKCKQATICVGDCCDAENIAKVFIFFLFIYF